MKKLSLILILAVSVFIAGTAIVQAVESSSEGISGYINNFYKTAIILGGVAAILVIIIGGLMWATSGAIDQKNKGRDLITSAIWGLVLLLGAFIILNTINPELTDLSEPGGVGEGIAGLGTEDLTTGGPEGNPYSCLYHQEVENLEPCPEGEKAVDLINDDGELTCCDSLPKCEGVENCTPPSTIELAPDESAKLECRKSDGTIREGYYATCASILGIGITEPKCLKEVGATFPGKLASCSGNNSDLKPMCLRTSPTGYRIVCAKEAEKDIYIPDCKRKSTCENNLETKSVTINLGGAWGTAAYYPEEEESDEKAQCVNYVYRKWSFTDWKYADLEGLKLCP